MELFAVFAFIILGWLLWQLYRAKQFTRFKQQIQQELTPKVIEAIQQQLQQEQCELTPNNDCHVQACIHYWCEYPVRVMQYALANDIITKAKLIKAGNYRHCQHLFHVQRHHMHHFKEDRTNKA